MFKATVLVTCKLHGCKANHLKPKWHVFQLCNHEATLSTSNRRLLFPNLDIRWISNAFSWHHHVWRVQYYKSPCADGEKMFSNWHMLQKRVAQNAAQNMTLLQKDLLAPVTFASNTPHHVALCPVLTNLNSQESVWPVVAHTSLTATHCDYALQGPASAGWWKIRQ
jgi:hypothetical protein